MTLKITSEEVKKGSLKEIFPEIYELKDVIENNPWHNNESTFDHTISVMKALEDEIAGDEKISVIFGEKIDNHTRKELFLLSVLFHDIAKKEAVTFSGGESSFPNHDNLGHQKVLPILARIGLSAKESGFVSDIIKNHNYFHKSFDNKDADCKEINREFKKQHPNIYFETLLLSMADTKTSFLQVTKENEYKMRMNFYNKSLGEALI